MQVGTSTNVDTTTYDKSKLDVDNKKGDLNQTDFLNLFITQLKNQDPTSPMDDSAMMQQTAMFSQVELLTNIDKNTTDMANGNSDTNLQQQMVSSSSFIGKIVEYKGNNTYLTNGAAAVSFKADEVPADTTVTIRDSQGNFVRSFKPDITDTDTNTFYWDGTDADGNAMPDGKYTFNVTAKNADGDDVNVTSYGNGLVTGIKTEDGSLVYEVDGSDVYADDVTSVRDASLGGA